MVTIEDILKKSQDTAIAALKKFINNIDLNTDDFNHIYNIQVQPTTAILPIDFSTYNPKQNIIKINEDILKKYIKKINEKQCAESVIEINVAKDIIHEMLHANRSITEIDPATNKEIRDLICAFYDRKPGEDDEYVETRIERQTNLEEIVTDALSEFIIKSRNDNVLSFEDNSEFLKKATDDKEVYLGLKILESLGENQKDVLKWYMTEAYTKERHDLFEETFKEDYDDLLYYVDEIYQTSYCGENIRIDDMIEALDIIDKNSNKVSKEKRRV